MPRKPKTQEPITPQELSALNDKTTQNPAVRKYHVAIDAKNIVGLKKRRKILRIILGAVTAVLLILFIISMLVSKWGDLVIEIDRPLQNRGIVLSTDPEFKTKSVALSAKQALNVTNITYSWLPTDLDTSKDGEHNGKNYVAYTFYCKNEGEAEVDYKATLDISGVAKSADEACLVMLSILEMPRREEWVVDLVPSQWKNDPKLLENGKFTLPPNMWYCGTINNDDSTFAVTDKVYDRAMPINIDNKGVAFEAPDTSPVVINYHHFEAILNKAKQENPVSEDILTKLALVDDYIISHFRVAFGNRIMKQIKDYVPAYIGTGGTEIDGLDYILARKVLRKFEALNLSYIRDEIDGLIAYMDELFGEENMGECKSYLCMLKKLV